jgi:hypothetical protein
VSKILSTTLLFLVVGCSSSVQQFDRHKQPIIEYPPLSDTTGAGAFYSRVIARPNFEKKQLEVSVRADEKLEKVALEKNGIEIFAWIWDRDKKPLHDLILYLPFEYFKEPADYAITTRTASALIWKGVLKGSF